MCRRAAATNEADPRLETALFSMPQVAPPSGLPQVAPPSRFPKYRPPPRLPRKAVIFQLPKCRHLPTPQMPSPFMKIRRRSRPDTAPNPTFLHDLRRGVAVFTVWDGKKQHAQCETGKGSMKGPRLPGEARALFCSCERLAVLATSCERRTAGRERGRGSNGQANAHAGARKGAQ